MAVNMDSVVNGKRKPDYDLANNDNKRQAQDRPSAYLTSQHIGLTGDLDPLLLHYLPLNSNNECFVLKSCMRKVEPVDADGGGIPGPTFVKVLDARANYMAMQQLQTVSLDAIENLVAPHGPALVDAFFAKVHPVFPVLVERRFKESYNAYVKTHTQSAGTGLSRGATQAVREDITAALLGAVYLLALPHLEPYPATASSQSLPHMQHVPAVPNVARLRSLTSQLLTESLSTAQAHPVLSTLQAGVLAAQDPELNTPSLISQLVSLTYELGLHADCGNWQNAGVSCVQRGLRRRLAWSVYVLDKWGALVHARPSLIREDDWGVIDLQASDFRGAFMNQSSDDETKDDTDQEVADENVECEHTLASLLFARTVSLTQILSSILSTFYTLAAINEIIRLAPPSSPPGLRTRVVLDMAKPIQLRLKEWYAGLPPCLRMEPQVASPGAVQLNDNGMSDDRGSRCLSESLSATVANGLEDDNVDRSLNGSLHLAYFAAEITLHRVIIRSLAVLASPENTANNATTSGNANTGTRAASAVSGLSADTTPAPGPAPTHDLGQYLTYICRSAAKTRLISALDFTNRLRPRHLTSTWPFYARFCLSLIGSFGLLLRITAATRSECAFYGRRVGEYVWTLGVSEGWGGEWVGWAGERVRELVDAVNHSNLPEKPDYAPEYSNRGGEGMPIGMNVNLGLSNWTSGGFGHHNPRLSFGLGINPEDASYVSENEDGVDMEGDEEMDEEMEGADEDINKHGAGENDNRERPVDQDAYDNGQGDINSDRATLDEHSATETTEATMTTAATKTVSTSKTTSAPMTPSLSDEPLFSSSRVPSKGPLSPPTPDHIQPVARHMRFHDRAEPGVSVECMAKLEC